jgi:aconitate hydratase
VPAIVARSYARIHRRNLIAVGIVPPVFAEDGDWSVAQVGQRWRIPGLARAVRTGADAVTAELDDDRVRVQLAMPLSPRERTVLEAGGLLALIDQGGRRPMLPPAPLRPPQHPTS